MGIAAESIVQLLVRKINPEPIAMRRAMKSPMAVAQLAVFGRSPGVSPVPVSE